jgi:Sec-independent protein translocase protein TatA
MDVYLLSPALLSLGELIKDANEILNGSAAESSLRVKSDFKTGSFEVSLVVGQTLLEATKSLFAAHPTVDAAGLVALLFGGAKKAPDIIEGVMRVYKALKGEKPQRSVIDQSTHTTIFNMGDGNTYKVEERTARLYEDERITRSFDKVLKPVSGVGIDSLEVRKDKAVIDHLEKNDLPLRVTNPSEARELALQPIDGTKLSSSRQAILRISKVNFEKGRWTFSDGQAKFGAEIEDEAFNEKVRRREEAFFAGDNLHVVMRTTQKLGKDNQLEQAHVIERVLEHTHAPQPQTLLLSSPEGQQSSTDEQKALPPSPE